eukprot:gene1791-2414_t
MVGRLRPLVRDFLGQKVIEFACTGRQHPLRPGSLMPNVNAKAALLPVRPVAQRQAFMKFSPPKLYTSSEVVDFLKDQGAAPELDGDDCELWNGRTPEDLFP